jgi:hypothetical protein
MLCGAGTDAAPSYSPFFSASGTRRYHVVAQSTPVGGVYYLELFVTVPGSASQDGGVIICEPMAPGSYDASDGDPCVWTVGGYGSSQFGWFGFGTAGQVWSAGISANVGPFGGALGVDLGSGGDVNGRPWYSASISGSVRIKGVGAFVAAKGPARTYPATMNTATDAYAYLGSWVYPYPDNIAPSVS